MINKTGKVNVRFECTQCGACCSEPDMIVTLTGRDVARIASGLGFRAEQMLKVVDFYVTTPGESLPIGLQNTSRVMTEQGLAIMALKKISSGECVFLKDKLCLIHSLRPGVCRAFPFVFSEDCNGINWGLSARKEICPGLGMGTKIDTNELLDLAHEILEDISFSDLILKEWNESLETHHASMLLEMILNDIRFNV